MTRFNDLLVLAIVLATTTTLFAQDGIIVPDDYATIQEAIDNAPDNSVVHVRAGVYEEHLSYNHTVILRSLDGPDTTIIDGTDSGTVIHISGPSGAPGGIRQVVDGFTIRNGRVSSNSGGGMHLTGNAALTLSNCTIRDNVHDTSEYGAGGIRIANASIAAEGCLFTGNRSNWNGTSVYVWQSNGNTFTNCTFELEGTGYVGTQKPLDIVHFQQSSSGTLTGCVFTDNAFLDSEIVLWVGCNVSVSDCSFLNADKTKTDPSGSIVSGTGSSMTTENLIVCAHPEPHFTDISHTDQGGSFFSSAVCDCNSDDILDYEQILDGSLQDDNGDGVPDLCEAVQWRVEDGGNGHWYRTFSAPGISWAEAEQQADDLGGHLSSLTNAEENGFVVSQFEYGVSTMPWIGLRQDNDGDWGWNTGEPFAWTNWSPLEPNGGSIEVEAIIWLTDAPPDRPLGTWNDYQTPHPNGGLIEWSADCNGDGIVDFGQILDGSVTDCNNNLIPDECELTEQFAFSVDRTPEPSNDVEFDLSSASDAVGDVTLKLSVLGDLGLPNQFVYVYLDETLLDFAFANDGLDCEEVTQDFIITDTEWNTAGLDGIRLIKILGVLIDPAACANPRTAIDVVLSIIPEDCDANGTWDECELDSDQDGTIDGCDNCPDDPYKTEPGICGCGVADTDSDNDDIADCVDPCPYWPGNCSEDGQTIFVAPGESIQAAIDGVPSGGIVEIGAGTFQPPATLDPGGKALTLRGTTDGFNGTPTTILDGQNTIRLLICQSGEGADTIFENLVIQNGFSTHGGGMHNSASSPTLSGCVFVNNTANDDGGGMYNSFSNPSLISCTFDGNRATNNATSCGGVGDGGGLYNWESSPTVDNCSFTSNYAHDEGGGMANWYNSSPIVTGCIFENNEACDEGGGMHNWVSSSPTVTDCTFIFNSTQYGGGMSNHDQSSPTLDNCTFDNHVGTKRGGGMYNQDSSPTMTNCTFTGNSATEDGGAISHHGDSSSSLTETLVCDNTHDQIAGDYTDLGNNCITDVCDSDGDETLDCYDNCPNDPDKTEPGDCGCGNPDTDTDGDTIPDCIDPCPNWPYNCSEDGQTIYVAVGEPIQNAINFVPNGGTVELANGSHYPNAVLTTGGRPMTILGGVDSSGQSTTLVDGLDAQRIFICNSGEGSDTVFENLWIRGGYQGTNGGGMLILDSSPSVVNCIFQLNNADLDGGAVYLENSSTTFTTCDFWNNSAGGGGGLYAGDSDLSLTNCNFIDNTASVYGGALFCNAGTYNLDGCIVTGNSSIDAGGGLYIVNGSATISQSRISSNTSNSYGGGGVLGFDATLDFDSCEITDNTSLGSQSGGGIRCWNSSSTMSACVIKDNFSAGDGGAIGNANGSTSQISGSSICGNTSGQISGPYTDNGGNCIQEDCGNDLDENGVPDDCDPDCDGDGEPDAYEISSGQDPDCNANSIPDTCEVADGSVEDCNTNGVPDSCDVDSGFEGDSNENGIPDVCELAAGDLNLDGCIDGGDLAVLLGLWGLPNPPIGDLNGDGIIGGADLASLLGSWRPCGG